MNGTSFSKLTEDMKAVLRKHSPEILTGIGIAGMITSAVMAVRATPRALVLIDAQCCEEEGVFKNLTPLAKVKTVWRCYIPAAATGAASIACLIGANSVHIRHRAALATAYALSETALKEYQAKVIETFGEKKDHAVRDAIAKDRIENTPVTSREVVITEKGNTLCYDSISGRYFKSDIDKLKKAENKLNRQMLNEMYVSLNDFYYEIGLSNSDIGYDLGWKINNGFVDLQFSSQLADDGTPCLVLDYRVAPRYDYQK